MPQLNLIWFLFTFELVDAWRKFVNNASKVIMLRNNRNIRLQEIVFVWKQNPIRKLESCESRFLWKNGSYSRTTWRTFAYHRLGTPGVRSGDSNAEDQPESSTTVYIVERELACFVCLCHQPLHWLRLLTRALCIGPCLCSYIFVSRWPSALILQVTWIKTCP